MRKLLTNEQMREVDAFAMKTVPSLELMERAGTAVAERVLNSLGGRHGSVVCVCGGGNNGGDGFVIARLLLEKGVAVSVLCRANKFSEETSKNRERFLSLGGEIVTELPKEQIAIIVDCVLGTGFRGQPREDVVELIEVINSQKEKGSYIISVDIPSGLCGDNGLGTVVVKADETLCVGEEKLGVWLLNGLDCAGEVSALDIGLRGFEWENYVNIFEQIDAVNRFPKRKRNSHKGSYGKVAILGGSVKYSGAGYLSCLSACKSGVGYTAWFMPEELLKNAFFKIPEALLVSTNVGGMYEYNEDVCQKLCEYDAVALGMGMTCSESVYKTILYLFEHYRGKLVLDADGLNSIAQFGSMEDFSKIKECDVVITPHLKELSRLTKLEMAVLQESPAFYAKEITGKYPITLLWKGASTLIAKAQELFLTVKGSSAQAKGGSGDVLSGFVGGLCAQGLSAFDGALLGAYLVGVSAEIATEKYSEYSATPTDFISCFGEAFNSLQR